MIYETPGGNIDIEPFTYYKNDKDRRAFLLADVVPPLNEYSGRVYLIEFGKPRTEGIAWDLPAFAQLLQQEKLVLFTPKFQ